MRMHPIAWAAAVLFASTVLAVGCTAEKSPSDDDDDDGTGGSTSSSGTGGGTTSSSSSSSTSSSSSSSTSSSSSSSTTGGTGTDMCPTATAPTACEDTHGFAGCCAANNVVYFWEEGAQQVLDCGSNGTFCGWQPDGPYYDCVESNNTADPAFPNDACCGGTNPYGDCT